MGFRHPKMFTTSICILLLNNDRRNYEQILLYFHRIGKTAILRFNKPCNRCPITTVNPDSGEKDPNLDPLKLSEGFVNPEKEVENIDDALKGAKDIIAEWINEDKTARAPP